MPGLPLPRTLSNERYVLEERIGVGAMAVVYRAHDTRLRVDRAIKMLTPDVDAGPALAQRMRAESRAMARLEHPHVVRLHDLGQEDGLEYMVMDLAATSLGARLNEHGAFPSHQVVLWMVQVLSALAAAHANGVVHRDVKPENILLDADNRALLTDFGIALLTDLRQTQTGAMLGSLAFMPPEQRMDATRVTHLADIYAAGATAYSMLTAENPADLFMATDDSPRWSKIHPGMAAVLRRACARHPEDRFQTAGEFADALGQVHPAPGVGLFPLPSAAFRARPAVASHGDGDTLLPDTSRRRGPLLAGLTAAALTFLAVVLATAPDSPSETPAPPTSAQPTLSGATTAALGTSPAWTGPPRDDLDSPQSTLSIVTPDAIDSGPSEVGRPNRPRKGRGSTFAHEGVWHANQNGVEVRFELRGPAHALRGSVVSRLGEKVHTASLTGVYDSSTRRLRLREPDSAAVYDLMLSTDGTIGSGQVNDHGTTRTLLLQRTR